MIQGSPVRFPETRRALAKQQTRRRLIAAAKQLVIERGYEAATLRNVAAVAEVSTGAVFANFADKADLFTAVILIEHKLLLDEMRQAPASDCSPRATLLSMLFVGYDLQFEQLPLVRAQLGFSWFGEPELERRWRGGVEAILASIVDVLKRGVSTGHLSPSINSNLIAEMIWESYLANFRQVMFEGWTVAAVRRRMADQIDVLLAGFSIGAPLGRQARMSSSRDGADQLPANTQDLRGSAAI
jgi:AcrR family transcriptional regulator